MSQTITSGFQGTDCFLESFFIVFTDTHDFPNGSHLSTKLIFHTLELFKRPAREFNYHIVSIRNILIQCAILATWNIL